MTAGALHRDALAVLQPGFTGTTAPDWLLRLAGEGLGSVGLFARNIASPAQLAALTAGLRAQNPYLLVAADEEGGDVTRLEAGTGSSFPGNLALGAVDDTALTRSVAGELGRRLAACGVNLDWAPCADVNSDPDNPVIGVRSFGSDPRLVARHTAAWTEGLQSAGVAACAKHFPGHGDTAVDSHLALPSIAVDRDTLAERELVPFRAAVAAGTKAVMTAHILLPALDPVRPATLSAAVLGLLRAPAAAGGLGFCGLVITDGLQMRAVSARYGIERAAVLALAAGADAVCLGGSPVGEQQVLRLRDALVAAVRCGEVPEQRLAEAAERVRAVGAWTAAEAVRRPAAPGEGDVAVGLAAARRALRTTAAGPYRPPAGPVYVATLTPSANIAAGGGTPWGPAAELDRLLPGTRSGTYRESDAVPGGAAGLAERIRAAANGRRIVAVVRDAHRHRWMAAVLDALLGARPETVVVEMGVPHAPPAGALHIATYGAGRVCAAAAAEAVAGRAVPAAPGAGPGAGG